jgi:hypothetical protein
VPDDAPFPYHGDVLHFPKGTVSARIEQGDGPGPWARLIPDAPVSGGSLMQRYKIDLGRASTGTDDATGIWLGNQYSSDALRTDLGDGYTLYCQPPERQVPAFDCAVLLRSLPLAAMEFRDRPASSSEARALVDDAEAFLTKARARD